MIPRSPWGLSLQSSRPAQPLYGFCHRRPDRPAGSPSAPGSHDARLRSAVARVTSGQSLLGRALVQGLARQSSLWGRNGSKTTAVPSKIGHRLESRGLCAETRAPRRQQPSANEAGTSPGAAQILDCRRAAAVPNMTGQSALKPRPIRPYSRANHHWFDLTRICRAAQRPRSPSCFFMQGRPQVSELWPRLAFEHHDPFCRQLTHSLLRGQRPRCSAPTCWLRFAPPRGFA